MPADERRSRIVAMTRAQGRIDIAATAHALGVSCETIRCDLSVLQRHGLIRRIRGAACPVESTGFELPLAQRTTRNPETKHRIAAAAVDLLGEAETVFIDEGHTPHLVATLLPAHRPFTLVTASLITAIAVAERPNLTVIQLGGMTRFSGPATVGSWARNMLGGFVIDIAFLSSSGISREAGVTTPDPATAEIKATAVGVSRRRIFTGDYSKFGCQSLCRFAHVHDLEVIVTDTALPAEQARHYARLGPRVLRV